MFSSILKRAAALVAVVLICAAAVCAQTGGVEGTVRVTENGVKKGVPNAVIDIYRTDVKGHWTVKADKVGHYVILGLPLQGTYTFVASGPNITPTYSAGIRITQTPVFDMNVEPGDGSTMTLDQIMAAQKSGGGPGRPGGPPLSGADKAKAEAARQEQDVKKKQHQELQAALDEGIKHFNKGHEFQKSNNYEAAASEFALAASVDPAADKAFIELSHRASASLADAQYQIGGDIFNKNKKAVPEAKLRFESAVKEITKALSVAYTDPSPSINNDLIVYYGILAKSVKTLIQFYNEADLVGDAAKALDKAASIDTANKTKWELLKGELYRLAYKTDEAVAVFKQVLGADPSNVDALYGLGLTLVASGDKAKLQDAANYLGDFVSKAPATDPRVDEVKGSLQALKNEFKVEAEKPAPAKRKKP